MVPQHNVKALAGFNRGRSVRMTASMKQCPPHFRLGKELLGVAQTLQLRKGRETWDCLRTGEAKAGADAPSRAQAQTACKHAIVNMKPQRALARRAHSVPDGVGRVLVDAHLWRSSWSKDDIEYALQCSSQAT